MSVNRGQLRAMRLLHIAAALGRGSWRLSVTTRIALEGGEVVGRGHQRLGLMFVIMRLTWRRVDDR